MKSVGAHDRDSSASCKESGAKRRNSGLAVRFLLLSVFLFLAPAPAVLVAQCLPSVTVTNANDSGAGSLRQAIADVCAGGVITFGGDMTITLASQLTTDKNVTIDGVGHTVTVSGNNAVRVFRSNSGVTLSLSQLTVTQGKLTGSGTGVRPDSCGAGILNAGTVILTNVTLSDNSGEDLGGGLYNDTNSSATLTSVTFRGNSAVAGGAMFNGQGSSATLTNVTFSGNSATVGAGGAIRNYYGNATLTNVTFTGNTAGGGGSCGGMDNWGGNVTVRNSILWGDTPCESRAIFTTSTFTDTAVQGGCPSGSTCTNVITSDPLIGPVGAYGGSTQTIPLLPGSLAINAGNAAYCTIGHDQRGVNYVGTCDMGAFESRGFTLTKSGGDAQHTPINTAFGNPLSVTLIETGGPALPGAVITFTPPGGGPSSVLSSGTATTNGSGIASVTATANGTAGGPYLVTASAAGGTPTLDFALTNDMVQDTAAPSLLSITRQNPGASPTNADILVFRVSFNEDVQNLLDVTADFTVNGTTTATVTGVAAVDARTYDVTVSGGDLAGFNGTVGLNLAPEQNITDTAGNPLPPGEPAIDQTYLLDNTTVAVISILRQNPLASPTNAAWVAFRVTFADDVQKVDPTDFSLAMTGTATGTINAIVVQSATVYDVVIIGVGGEGALDLNPAAGNDIADLVGNALGPSPIIGTEQTYTVDRTAPSVTISQAAGQNDPTSASPVNFTVLFSEPVTDFTSGDVTVGGPAGATTATVTEALPGGATSPLAVSGGGQATAATATEAGPAQTAGYTVAVSGMTRGGTVVITIGAGVAHDAASNENTAAANADNSVTFAFGTTTTLTASPSPSVVGQAVTFTARVTSAGGNPTGQVTFREGTTTLGTGSVNGSGEASFTAAGLSVGTHTIIAEYGGDANFAGSASSPLDHLVQGSAAIQIPTLNQWGLLALMALLACVPVYYLRRRTTWR